MSSGVPERIQPGTASWDKGFAEHSQRYAFASGRCAGKRVLDAACGVGYGAAILLDGGAKSVLGLDVSAEAIEIANSQYLRSGLLFRVDDCETMCTVESPIDVIVALECVEHFRKPDTFLARCAELLPADGTLILSAPNDDRQRLPGARRVANPFHLREFTYAPLKALLDKYFDDVVIEFQVKSPVATLREELERFVAFEYKVNPFLRAGLWLRHRLNRPGPDPLVRPAAGHLAGYKIVSQLAEGDDATNFLAVCRKPKQAPSQ